MLRLGLGWPRARMAKMRARQRMASWANNLRNLKPAAVRRDLVVSPERL